MSNNSVKKCVICNNEKCGEFITINDKKYHLCCIEQLQNNWNKLKKFVEAKVKHWEEEEKKWIELGFMKFGGEANNKLIFKIVLNKMQELEQRKDE